MSDIKPWLISPVGNDELVAMCRSAFGEHTRLTHCEQVQSVQFNTCYRVRTESPDIEAILRIAAIPDAARLLA